MKKKVDLKNLDAKDRSFLKSYGELHPINDIDDHLSKKIQIVRDDEEHDNRRRYKKTKVEEPVEEVEALEDIVMPYQKLLEDLATSEQTHRPVKPTKNKKKKPDSEEKESEKEDDTGGESDIDDDQVNINTHSLEVFSRDNLDSDESIKNDPFHKHFETNLDSSLVEKLKSGGPVVDATRRATQVQWPHLNTFNYTAPLDEKRLNLDPNRTVKQLYIKQRILDRLNEAADVIFKDQDEALDGVQLETLNIISNYSDFYNPCVGVDADTRNKFTYAIHVLNHALKTRSRIIAHNDKIKSSNNADVEYRDQGLTRPKILIMVPYRKHALKLVKMFIALLMRKNEEFVSNKKRFFDSFGPDDDDVDDDKEDAAEKDDGEVKKAEDFNFLLGGNTDDHFRMGLSVSKKSLKLFTEFYSSDIIIASPLGLKSVIDNDKDHDFLSSIEVLVVDNADVLLMQNWEHVLCVLDHLHLQPKQSHDVDYSRVRYWLLEGQSSLYRQTIIFSRIPAPPINSIFNKYCKNYNGKCVTDVLKTPKYQLGTICQIGFQLGQVFNRIECDSPADLPEARFRFFLDKVLPKFRDDMMSHTLIFIPSYFDFVKLRNHFKKNDISSMNVNEYTDKKSIDRARYLFFHGKVHFMLLTERFFFYKRYRIRGINHLIFYELPHYAEFYSNFCNFLPDVKRAKSSSYSLDTFTCTSLYSKYDAQKLCSIVGQQRATHMLNSEKSVHMFMTE